LKDLDLNLYSVSFIAALLNVIIFQNFPAAIALTVVTLLFGFVLSQNDKKLEREEKLYDLNLLSIQTQLDRLTSEFDSVSKVADEAKKLVSQQSLSQGFVRPTREKRQ
jgi:uncharacterized membrane protein YhiD involved in acid resistance